MPSLKSANPMLACILLFTFFFSNVSFAQTVPVTFKYENIWRDDPAVYLASTLNDWQSNHPDYKMIDDDDDGIYEITIDIDPNQTTNLEYRFVADGGWYKDPMNPDDTGDPWFNSVMNISDPMITYLHPMDNAFK
ncbi:MAG: hypothetical protein R3182_07110, partial [Draconibacterium sp.]|nr:hypothetical protein [Draconibacterium sp.]